MVQDKPNKSFICLHGDTCARLCKHNIASVNLLLLSKAIPFSMFIKHPRASHFNWKMLPFHSDISSPSVYSKFHWRFVVNGVEEVIEISSAYEAENQKELSRREVNCV